MIIFLKKNDYFIKQIIIYQMNTRVDLIKYIREKSPKLTGVYKMKKNELEEIYNKLTEIKEEVKERLKRKKKKK